MTRRPGRYLSGPGRPGTSAAVPVTLELRSEDPGVLVEFEEPVAPEHLEHTPDVLLADPQISLPGQLTPDAAVLFLDDAQERVDVP